MKAVMECEVDRFKSESVLEKVDFSEWTAPTVVVPKKMVRCIFVVTIRPQSTLFSTLISTHYHDLISCLPC